MVHVGLATRVDITVLPRNRESNPVIAVLQNILCTKTF